MLHTHLSSEAVSGWRTKWTQSDPTPQNKKNFVRLLRMTVHLGMHPAVLSSTPLIESFSFSLTIITLQILGWQWLSWLSAPRPKSSGEGQILGSVPSLTLWLSFHIPSNSSFTTVQSIDAVLNGRQSDHQAQFWKWLEQVVHWFQKVL
jgi:hypothetical protein